MTTLEFAVGEDKQKRTYQVLSGPASTDSPVNLTTASTGRVIIGGGFPVATKSVTLTLDSTGTVTLEFDAAQLTTAGRYPFQTEVTFADGTVTRWPKPGYDTIEVGGNPPG